MPRVTLNRWLQGITSVNGPTNQRHRHIAHALAVYMRGDGSTGSFPGMRALAIATSMNRRTIAAGLTSLEAEEFVDVVRTRGQYGRTRCRYFPALPDWCIQSAPMNNRIDASRVHQSSDEAISRPANGAVASSIGALSSGNGASRVHPKLPLETSTEGATTQARQAARAAARGMRIAQPITASDLTDKIQHLIEKGQEDTAVVDSLRTYNVTLDQVQHVRAGDP